jgi:hypothetical protein
MIPYLKNLNWRSHLYAEPANTWLGWNEFASDANLYEEEIIESLGYWSGHGQLLVAGAYFGNQFSREVLSFFLFLRDMISMSRMECIQPVPLLISLHRWTTLPCLHEGTVIPIGKPHITLTQREGNSHVLTEDQGGVVGYDDLCVL